MGQKNYYKKQTDIIETKTNSNNGNKYFYRMFIFVIEEFMTK